MGLAHLRGAGPSSPYWNRTGRKPTRLGRRPPLAARREPPVLRPISNGHMRTRGWSGSIPGTEKVTCRRKHSRWKCARGGHQPGAPLGQVARAERVHCKGFVQLALAGVHRGKGGRIYYHLRHPLPRHLEHALAIGDVQLRTAEREAFMVWRCAEQLDDLAVRLGRRHP